MNDVTTQRPATGTVPPAGLSQPRYQELEAFRGLAALAVVVYHAWQHTQLDGAYPFTGRPAGTLLAGLDAAVAVFLVLSGFLLFLPVVRAVLDGRPTRDARSFLRRRFARVLPLYVIAVTAVWAYRTPSFPGDWRDLLAHLTFTHIYSERTIFSLIGPAWSLAVEITFYLLIALSLWPLSQVARRVPRRGTRLAVVIAFPLLLVVGSLAYKAWAFGIAEIPLDRFTVYFGLAAKLDEFGLGMLLAVAFAARGHDRPWPRAVALAVRLTALGVAVLAFSTRGLGGWYAVMFHSVVSVAAV